MISKPIQGTPFDGRSSEMRDSPWLASEDLLGLGEIIVEIEQCYQHKDVEFEAGRKRPVAYALQFKGKAKQLVLNSTNRKTLVKKFGADVREWKGKKITLWVDHNVKLAGQKVSGIRIK